MAVEEEEDAGIPEWVVTFGDMMSLLLTFFIMLVSMSEIKEEEKFLAMIESMRQHFGHEASPLSFVPGNSPPRNSVLQHLASMGRAKRKDLMRGGQPVKAPVGDHARVQTVRPGKHSTVGGVIYFEEESAELTSENKQTLHQIIDQIAGKPQKIEIRGHTSRKPVQPTDVFDDLWDLSYQRCRNTMQFLVERGIDPGRIRLGAAGPHEPLDNGIDPGSRQRNARVQILMWDEPIVDLSSEAEESSNLKP